MIRNLTNRILVIALVLIVALWIDLNDKITIPNPFDQNTNLFERNVKPRLGLDLQGGLQVLLEADLPESAQVSRDSMETARAIVENRTNALGVSENVIQVAGDRRIVGEFPGAEDADAILDIIQQTGLLEFVDMGDFTPEEGSILQTDYLPGSTEPAAQPSDGSTVFHTVMTGKDLSSVNVGQDPNTGEIGINFVLSSEGAQVFGAYTSANIGKTLAIVLDKVVISAPRINDAITSGQGTISGNFTNATANALAVQLRYGSLPIPLKVVETRIIGPTLGEDSLQKSLLAGTVGLVIVVLFMGTYYRLPGIAADVSILLYAAILFAVFKWIGVTLTLPGIAGIMLSTGSALDANILIFERLKEELRAGRTLRQAFDQAWSRAWPSIRDSNIAALITAGILFWFGSTFGATIVKGFSLTLALGVLISLFSSLYITHALLALAFDIFKPKNYERWIGI
ncbi:MAG: Protein translocase subunit SecDF [Anaerolineales bacterium]|nr:Protein translocase subunit SecDF [Anaerolineales bacterium]WKZ48663.1 MAG: protein translocase subunit SecD [Anaerolineales bacterium]